MFDSIMASMLLNVSCGISSNKGYITIRGHTAY